MASFKPEVFVFENVPGILSACPGDIPVTKRIFDAFAKIGYNADKKVVFVNEFEASYTPTTDDLHLKVVVDRCSIELFTGDGVRSISLATFPEPGASRELELFKE